MSLTYPERTVCSCKPFLVNLWTPLQNIKNKMPKKKQSINAIMLWPNTGCMTINIVRSVKSLLNHVCENRKSYLHVLYFWDAFMANSLFFLYDGILVPRKKIK